MHITSSIEKIFKDHVVSGDHAQSDYFQAIKKLVINRNYSTDRVEKAGRKLSMMCMRFSMVKLLPTQADH